MKKAQFADELGFVHSPKNTTSYFLHTREFH